MINEESINEILSQSIDGLTTINDLREKGYTNPHSLTPSERKAIKAFDAYRLAALKSANEDTFHNMYLKIQVLANLAPYTEFLNPEYQEFSE